MAHPAATHSTPGTTVPEPSDQRHRCEPRGQVSAACATILLRSGPVECPPTSPPSGSDLYDPTTNEAPTMRFYRRCVHSGPVAISDNDVEHLASLRGTRAGRAGGRRRTVRLHSGRRRRRDAVRGPQPGQGRRRHPTSRVRDRPLGGGEHGSGATGARNRLHLRRALPDVLGRTRLGRPRPHRLRHILGSSCPSGATSGVRRRRRWRRCPITTVAPASSPTGPRPNSRRDEGALRGEVPAVTEPAGSSTRSGGRSTRSASSARSPPTRPPPRTNTGCGGSPNGSTMPSTRRLRYRAWAAVRLPHPRLRHHRPLPHRPAAGR